MDHKYFNEAVKITVENIENGGRPFGAVIVKDGKIIARAVNTMLHDHDPTAHAEMSALRLAGKALKSVDLSGSVVYATGEPCPMCQAAIYMAGIREVYFLFSNDDGEPYHLSTSKIVTEMKRDPNERAGFTFQEVPKAEKLNYVNLYALWDSQQ